MRLIIVLFIGFFTHCLLGEMSLMYRLGHLLIRANTAQLHSFHTGIKLITRAALLGYGKAMADIRLLPSVIKFPE